MNKFNELYDKLMEDNTAGPGGVFGDYTQSQFSSGDLYAPGDMRVPKVLGAKKVKGKKKVKFPIQRRSFPSA